MAWTAMMPRRRDGDKLFSRTALAIFAVGALLLAAGVYGAWRVHRLHKRGSDMLSENVASIRAAEQFKVVTREIRHRLKRYLSSGNERHLADVEDLASSAGTEIKEVEDLATTRRERRLTRRMREHYERLQTDIESLASEPSHIVRRETMLGLTDHLIPDRILENTNEYIKLNEQALNRSNQRNQSTANRLMFGLLLLGTCGGVAGLIVGYGIARLVNRTIVQLALPIRDAAGKLSQVAGPVTWSAEPGFDDLESVLQSVSNQVTTVVERLQNSERDRLRAEQLAAVGQLAAGLAHELRNPLTSMKAILQLAPEPGELTSRDLDVMREETARLEHTVQSLLDFARPRQPHKAETDLDKVLDQSASLVERGCQRKGVTLRYVPPDDEIRVMADGAQLRQLILNLVLNAVDVTPRGGEIVLECKLESTKGGRLKNSIPIGREGRRTWAVIRVSDTGPGLPGELRERLFEPFITTKATGTGLGLSICKRIVQFHDGVIAAHNGSAGGAVFEVRFPLDGNADRSWSPLPDGRKSVAEHSPERFASDADPFELNREA